MSIGVGIFLLTVGAILAFAVSDRISGVELTAVGYILMGAGVLGMVLSIMLSNRRRDRDNPIDPAVEDQYRVDEVTRVDEPIVDPTGRRVIRRTREH